MWLFLRLKSAHSFHYYLVRVHQDLRGEAGSLSRSLHPLQCLRRCRHYWKTRFLCRTNMLFHSLCTFWTYRMSPAQQKSASQPVATSRMNFALFLRSYPLGVVFTSSTACRHAKKFASHFHDLVGQDITGFYHPTNYSTVSFVHDELDTNHMPWTVFEIYKAAVDNLMGFSNDLVRYSRKVGCHLDGEGCITCMYQFHHFIFLQYSCLQMTVTDFVLCNSYNLVSPRAFKTSSRIVHEDLGDFATKIVTLDSPWNQNLANMTATAMQHRMLILRFCHAILLCHTEFLSCAEEAQERAMDRQPNFAHPDSPESHLWDYSAVATSWDRVAYDIGDFSVTIDALMDISRLCPEAENLPQLKVFLKSLLVIGFESSRNKKRAKAISRTLDSSITGTGSC
ncbi:hypothetical protein BJY01DRAFT_93295 [Aspergillus pseudoustus]|uniref:Transcription factor domain-containing protein n=1 Tax=Aspergillus pseudoustus TaxID=1810923 RepID=A0ABR4J347_9EURO